MPGVSPLLLGRGTYGSPQTHPFKGKRVEGETRRCLLLGGIRLCVPPAPRRATHRRRLDLLRRGRPFHQLPWECHPQGIILPHGLCRFCSVAIPLGIPACAGPAARWRGDFPQEGGSAPFPNPRRGRRQSPHFPWPPSGSWPKNEIVTLLKTFAMSNPLFTVNQLYQYLN